MKGVKIGKYEVVNLTPHPIRFLDVNGEEIVTIPSHGVIRLPERRVLEEVIGRIPVYRKAFGSEADLPPRQEGVLYIVSLPVAQAFPERDDFLVPDSLVRDEDGRIVGAQALSRVAKR